MNLVDGLVSDLKHGIRNSAADIMGSGEAIWGVVNNNPEKMRALLNHMMVPQFKPTIVDRAPPVDVGFQLLGPAYEEKPSIPLRMFNIDTGNMSVEWLDNNDVNQYCILSHSWKGAEVDLAYVNAAREHNRKKVVESKKAGAESDIEMIVNLSRERIMEKKTAIEGLLTACADKKPDYDVAKILKEYIDIRLAKRSFKDAEKEFQNAKSKLQFANLERDAFRNLTTEMAKTISVDSCHIRRGRAKPEPEQDEKDPGAKDVEKATDELNEAQNKLLLKEKEKDALQPNIDFLEHDDQIPLREAVEGLFEALQKWKSAIKIKESADRARKIFDTGIFPSKGKGKRFLWNDTCCIDKRNSGELVDSLSLMGDWYSNADFCLVHLDTHPTDEEWNDELSRFLESTSDKIVLPKPANITSYSDIAKANPAWSTRGWTLQELVLSKTTFYVNSAWEPLTRPQERLGPYYFLCPFIELYTRGKLSEDDLARLKADQLKLRRVWKEAVTEHKLTIPGAETKNKEKNPEDEEKDSKNEEKHPEDEEINAGQHLIAILEALELQIPSGIDKETAIPLIDQVVYLAAVGLRKEVKANDSEKFRLQNNISVKLKEYMFPTAKGSKIEDEPRRMMMVLLHCLVIETKDAIIRDRKHIAKFGKVEPLVNWQSGTMRTSFPSQKVMSLACNRETTVETDRAYSLMGLLGVRFPTFKAEGMLKALTRLFDESLIKSNDVSVFNWTGREMGNNIRGRSLYPSRLEAFDPNRVEGQSRANKHLATLLQTKRTKVMRTFHTICEMLPETIRFVKKYNHHKHLPMDWLCNVVNFIFEADFEDLELQIEDLEKILKWVENKCTQAWNNKDKKKTPHFISSDSVADLAKNPMKGLMGGLSKKRSISGLFDSHRSSKRAKTEDGSPASPTLSTADTLVEPYDESKLKEDVKRLGEGVMSYLESSLKSLQGKEEAEQRMKKVTPLPEDVLTELTQGLRQTSDEGLGNASKPAESDDMISPNPIIVNSSGIEGIFDIQRVVVTFAEEGKLWDQVVKAVSPNQKITGWCSISTGFARVMVSFSCAQHILEQQLKVSQVVQKKVVDEPARPHEADFIRKLRGTSKDEVASKPSEHKPPSASSEHAKAQHKAQHTDDERRVSRMIDFVQQEPLHAVAGEWVLARFSDVPGARWFLCSFELGSSTSAFYGRRVATDRIDFAHAIPEPGLINVWQAYMNRKKRKLCNILRDTLLSKRMCSAKDFIFYPDDDDEKDDGEDEGSDNILANAFELGMTAVKNARELAILGLRERWYELKASMLDSQLTAVVLKKTPKELQPAVENLNADQDFLPAAFRSGIRIHMF